MRRDPTQIVALLHPEFVEFGSSGRVWGRAEIVRAVASDPGTSVPEVSELETKRLGPDAILLTYRLQASQQTLRSSVWLRDRDGVWLLRFHQGTPVS